MVSITIGTAAAAASVLIWDTITPVQLVLIWDTTMAIPFMAASTRGVLTMAQVYRETTQRDLRQDLKSGTGGKLGKLVRVTAY